MKKPLLDFISLSVAAKIAFYRNVIIKLTGNPSFTTPDKPLADLKVLVDKLESDFIAAKDGGRTPTANMHKSEAAADTAFRIIAAYVDRLAANDEAKILSAGFHASKDREAFNKPELAAFDGATSGGVHLVAKALPDAGSYIWQQTTADKPEAWSNVGYSTQAYYDLTGLEVGTKYRFRVAAVTPNGLTDFTAPVEKVVV